MNKIKILVVEDESIVALGISEDLKELGYEVTDIASDFDEAIKCFKKDEPQLIIMDINLGKNEDGIKTIQAIQKIKPTPFIYLTAYCDNDTIQRAILTNPITYLVKPLDINELNAAILLGLFKEKNKHLNAKRTDTLALGYDYFFDFENSNLYYKTKPIKLGEKEKKLLIMLIEAEGSFLSFENIENEIWREELPSHSSLRTLVYRLRCKLEHKLIETINGIGCRLKI